MGKGDIIAAIEAEQLKTNIRAVVLLGGVPKRVVVETFDLTRIFFFWEM